MENNNNVNSGLKSRNSLKNVEFYLYRRGRHARIMPVHDTPLSLFLLLSFFFSFSLLFFSFRFSLRCLFFPLFFAPVSASLPGGDFFANNQPLRGEHIK